MKTRLTFLLVLLISATSAFGQTQTVNIEKPWKDVTKQGFYEMAEDQVDSLIVDHFYKRKQMGALLLTAGIVVNPRFISTNTSDSPTTTIINGIVIIGSLALITGGIRFMTHYRRKILFQHLTGQVPLSEDEILRIVKDRYEEENGE